MGFAGLATKSFSARPNCFAREETVSAFVLSEMNTSKMVSSCCAGVEVVLGFKWNVKSYVNY